MTQRRVAPAVLDLFSGAGGMTKGFVDEGFRPVGAVEIDPAAAASYAANYGQDHVFLGGICDFLEEEIPQALVLSMRNVKRTVASPASKSLTRETWASRR